MRPLGTWLVVGGLAVLGLFAARDALRTEKPRPASARDATSNVAPSPPRIPGRVRTAAELRAAGVEGGLYLTDSRCRPRALRLPSLEWISREAGVPGGCRFALSPDGTDLLFGRAVWSPDGRLAAVEQHPPASARRVRVFSRFFGWSLALLGEAPSFKPDGTLTYVRDGAVYEWTARCPRGTPTLPFGGRNAIHRCRRLVVSARTAGPFSEARWLDNRTVAGIAGGRLVIVAGGRLRAAFGSPASGLSDVDTSPRGHWVAVRLGRELVLLDRRLAFETTHVGIGQVRAIDWSPDERWVVAATRVSVWFFRPNDASQPPIRMRLTAADVAWR